MYIACQRLPIHNFCILIFYCSVVVVWMKKKTAVVETDTHVTVCEYELNIY